MAFFLFRPCLSFFSCRFISSKKLVYYQIGNPSEVLKQVNESLPTLASDDILVKICAAPVHPADINTIHGVYPIKPSLPATPGNEGVGQVVECGSSVHDFSIGDYVIPATLFSGTWREHLLCKSSSLLKISQSLPISSMSILSTNPSTALRMLTSFKTLPQGHAVIQNGSTSAVGIYVIQIAKLLGLKTINLFRSRGSKQLNDKIRDSLMSFGADLVITDEEFKDAKNVSAIEGLGPILLGLNCLGGKSVLPLIRFMSREGVLVTYGAMTRQPMIVPAGPLIFSDISLRGFWLSSLVGKNPHSPERLSTLDQIVRWFHSGELKPSPFVEVPFSNWKKAIDAASFSDQPPTELTKKAILVMES